MATDVSVAASFLEDYDKKRSSFVEGAQLLAENVKHLLDGSNVFVHSVEARAKTLSSVREKLLRKNYKEPKRALTDLIGLRVITYYSAEVDDVVEIIRSNFRIHKGHSADKRTVLSLREFGYRSYHQVSMIKKDHLADSKFEFLKGIWFEIQVRSLLEHCWAAMEHEIVYKSGAVFPDECRRRFAAVAGSLELLDREFAALRSEQSTLIDSVRDRLDKGNCLDDQMDTTSMLAGLELWRPGGLSFRDAEESGKPFPPKIGTGLVLAMHESGVDTPAKLNDYLNSSVFISAVSRYATSEGVAPDDVSHLAVLSIIVGLQGWDRLQTFFPELTRDPSLILALGK